MRISRRGTEDAALRAVNAALSAVARATAPKPIALP